jgi:hypothetical protein
MPTQSQGDHRYGIKQAAGYARIVPLPPITASPPTEPFENSDTA